MKLILLLVVKFNILFAFGKNEDLVYKFKQAVKKEKTGVVSLINNADSWGLYKVASFIDAHNQMYLATGNKVYLDSALSYIERAVRTSQESKFISKNFKDNYKGWVNKSHPQLGNDRKEYPLYESYFWRYATSTFVLSKGDNRISPNRYMHLVDFCEKNIYEKWWNRGEENLFRSTSNMSALWAHIALNLFVVTHKGKYENFSKSFAQSLNKHILFKNGKLNNWNLYLDSKKNKKTVQDVSHGNAEVSFIIDAFKLTSYFDRNIIDNLISILYYSILKEGGVSKYVDGSGFDKGNRYLIDGFYKLGRFSDILNIQLNKTKFINKSEYYRESQYIAVLFANQKLLKK